MSPILSILRAAHCRSTHHFFALDALRLVQTDAGQRFRSLLLKHHEQYLTGSKDPDDRFRDFQNHVIHVQDGYFGGATRVAIVWYERLLGHLALGRWDDAAYAMGVLSHYFTDPLMPLHTAQSSREAIVHRPIEWSVCKAYPRILKRWTEDDLRLVFHLGDGDGWLGEAILKGARFANRSYKRLVESYNLDIGADNPDAAIDLELLQIFAELFGLAITGLARLIERAAEEAERRSGTRLPKVSLTLPALLATLQMPEQWWLKRIHDRQEREAVEAIVAEFRETGTVRDNIPSEVYIKQRVMEVRQQEAAWNKRRQALRQQALAAGAQPAVISSVMPSEVLTESAPTLESIASAASQPLLPEQQVLPRSLEKQADAPEVLNPFSLVARDENSAVAGQSGDGEEPVVAPEQVISVAFPNVTANKTQAGRTRGTLQRKDELAKAPSIGPKTASAFAEIRIFTIGEFLDAPAVALARRLGKSWVTTNVIEQWQAQTQLMCDVPGLLVRDVQMLVGIGWGTAEQLAAADVTMLVNQMRRYASTPDGKRILRGAGAAKFEQVQQWIADAKQACGASHNSGRRAA